MNTDDNFYSSDSLKFHTSEKSESLFYDHSVNNITMEEITSTFPFFFNFFKK